MPSLLIIKSDYANCYVPFLAPHYSRITLVDPEMLSDGESLTDIANPNDYDQVLFLYDVKSFCEAENLDKIN
jgi:hypothetical protein